MNLDRLRTMWYAYRRWRRIRRMMREGKCGAMVKWLQGKKTEILVGLVIVISVLGLEDVTFDPISPQLADQLVKLILLFLPVTLGARIKRVLAAVREAEKKREEG